ncbi:MAG: CPBP family intramembrane metalloprotease [Leptolyngbyaceae cyanobacterium CSU_1_4]|nr:CPBP family intramembrane metalloprotease [Leptolyngbyaceae cyanobacterium CSU_1_4]
MADWAKARAAFQIFLFFGVWLVLWLPIAIPLAIALKWHPPQPLTLTQKLPLLVSLYLLAPLVLWGVAALAGASFEIYGLPWKPSVLYSLIQGMGGGILGLAILFGIEGILGWVRWQPPAQDVLKTLIATLALGIGVGLIEELVFRGFLLNQLQQDYLPWMAAAIASLMFALLHLVWEGKENIPQLPGLWLMGMVLVLARWVDGGELGLAWGLHAGWIWAIATLDTAELIAPTGKGAAWLTGWGGKPLAGALGILFLLGTGGALWVMGGELGH